VIRKTTPTITTTASMVVASTVTPNMTPEELVKFMDLAVSSNYGNDLSNLTRVITDDVCSTLESFKTDLQNTLLGKLDQLCSKYRVRCRVNNRILHIAHLTQVTQMHRVTWSHSSRVALLHRVTWGF
jgi:hypothetical protein